MLSLKRRLPSRRCPLTRAHFSAQPDASTYLVPNAGVHPYANPGSNTRAQSYPGAHCGPISHAHPYTGAHPTPPPTPTPVPLQWPTPAVPGPCDVHDVRNLITYSSGGVQVSGAFYRPQATGYQPQPTGPLPAMLVLHTRGGLSRHERDFAAWLASQGYVALAPDYFAPMGVTPQTYEVAPFYAQYTDRVRELLARGLDCLKSLAYVDKDRIGVVGFSLGGYVALVLATRDDIVAQVRASVLILHGEADTTAPIARASTTHRLMIERGKQSELVMYPGVEREF